MTHVTYRIPKSHVGLAEKLFAAYQVPYEEVQETLDPTGAWIVAPALDESSGANQIFQDRFHK